MTICIGVVDPVGRHVYVGADSGCSCNSFYTSTRTPKVFHVNEQIVIGCAGSIRMANLLYSDNGLFDGVSETVCDDTIKELITVFIPKLKTHVETLNKEDSAFDLILGFKNRLYRIQSDLGIYESSTGLETIGSACEVAYGAMKAMSNYASEVSMREKIYKAIEICSQYSYGIVTKDARVLSTREMVCLKPHG